MWGQRPNCDHWESAERISERTTVLPASPAGTRRYQRGICTIGTIGLKSVGQWIIPSGKRLHNYGKIIMLLMGKIHYFDWAIFNSYVSLPEGTISLLIFLDQSSRFLWIWQLHPAAITLDPCGKPVTRLWNLHKDQNPTAFGNFLETLQLFQNAGETPPWCNCRANKKKRNKIG